MSGFAARDGLEPIDRAVEGQDCANAGRFGLGDEIGLGEVETLEFVDLERSKQSPGMDGLDRPQPDRRSHQLCDARSLDIAERLQDIDAFRECEIGQQEVVVTRESSCGTRAAISGGSPVRWRINTFVSMNAFSVAAQPALREFG